MLAIIVASCLLLAPLYIVYKPPGFVVDYCERRWPDVLWRVPMRQKVVALTLDDGPSQFTEQILRILEANGAKATFFVIGSHMKGFGEVLRDLVRRDHELANHAVEDEPSRSLSDAVLSEQLLAVQDDINAVYSGAGCEAPPRLFRPGHGFFTSRMRALLDRLGFRLVLGNVYPFDPQIPFSTINSRHILSMARPGSIIVCHDGRPWTPPMLQRVLPQLKQRGYRIVTVTELLALS